MPQVNEKEIKEEFGKDEIAFEIWKIKRQKEIDDASIDRERRVTTYVNKLVHEGHLENTCSCAKGLHVVKDQVEF